MGKTTLIPYKFKMSKCNLNLILIKMNPRGQTIAGHLEIL